MAKARILKVVNYREEDIPTLQKLEETLKREGKQYTEWVREQGQQYVKVHGSGNPSFTLETFSSPEIKAFPTAWKTLGRDDLAGYSQEDRQEMLDRLRKNAETLQYIVEHPVATKSSGQRR